MALFEDIDRVFHGKPGDKRRLRVYRIAEMILIYKILEKILGRIKPFRGFFRGSVKLEHIFVVCLTENRGQPWDTPPAYELHKYA